MRIAYVNQTVDRVRPPVQSSLGIWTWQVGRRLAVDHEVAIYTRRSRWRMQEQHGDGMVYRNAPRLWDKRLAPVLSPFIKDRGEGRPAFASSANELGYITAVALDLRRKGVDVIHVLNNSQFMPVLRTFNRDALLVLHMQCEWLHQLDPALLAPRLACCDLILGCSEYIARHAAEWNPQVADRCHAVFNGCDVERFDTEPAPAPADAGRRLLFVGRVSPEKGLHVLVDAWVELAERHPDLHLDLVGDISSLPRNLIVDLSRDPIINALERFYDDSSYREHLESRVPAELKDRLHFVGNVPQADLVSHYQAAEVFILPSSCHEAFGMPLAEAMACGKPTVGTRAGGIPELFDEGRTGFVVEREDPSALAEAIGKLLDDPELRREMGRRGRERCRELFSWDVIASETKKRYDWALEHKRRA